MSKYRGTTSYTIASRIYTSFPHRLRFILHCDFANTTNNTLRRQRIFRLSIIVGVCTRTKRSANYSSFSVHRERLDLTRPSPARLVIKRIKLAARSMFGREVRSILGQRALAPPGRQPEGRDPFQRYSSPSPAAQGDFPTPWRPVPVPPR